MNKKTVYWLLFGTCALAMAFVQFIPSAPVQVPALLPETQRAAHRVLNFEGIDNFRDLGGYPAADNKTVKWGRLYRSANFAHASRADNQVLAGMGIEALVDFRSAAEKEEEPNQFSEPPPFRIVEIPTMDGGDNSVATEIMARVDSGNFSDFDPDAFMVAANRHFADRFTPEFASFIQVVLRAQGRPVVWHCSAGKDRTGFAAAILLRILGVSESTVLEDYMLSKQYSLDARKRDLMLLRLFKGEEAADKIALLLGVEEPWLQAAFDEIDEHYGSFDNYVTQGLQLGPEDIASLRRHLLE